MGASDQCWTDPEPLPARAVCAAVPLSYDFARWVRQQLDRRERREACRSGGIEEPLVVGHE